jgi:outer membrane receptor protein involved in Fe transport
MNATLFQHDAKDAHNSMIYGTSAITNTIDYVHTGLEIQSRFLLGENTSIDFNLFALDSEIGDESLYDPSNPFGLSTGQRLSPIATDGPGFSNLVQAPGFGEQLYGLLGSAAPFCNFAAFAEGIVGKCQGVFVVNPDILALPGFAQIARVDLSGNRMPGTRELDYNISLNHMMMTENGSLDLRATMSKKSDMYASLFNLERSRVPEQTYFDMITTYRPNNGDWYVGVYGKNLADDRQLIGIDRGSEVEGSVLNATIGAPRTYGVNFGINF